MFQKDDINEVTEFVTDQHSNKLSNEINNKVDKILEERRAIR